MRLETTRLALRWFTPSDAELMLAIWNDPDFLEYVGDRGIRTVDDARTTLEEETLAMYSEFGFGPFRLALLGDGTPIGTCGIYKRETLADPDIGFALLPPFRAGGYAHEAARAVVRHAVNDLGFAHIKAIVSPRNRPSIRLIEKLGMSFEELIRLPDDDENVRLYGMDLPATGGE